MEILGEAEGKLSCKSSGSLREYHRRNANQKPRQLSCRSRESLRQCGRPYANHKTLNLAARRTRHTSPERGERGAYQTGKGTGVPGGQQSLLRSGR